MEKGRSLIFLSLVTGLFFASCVKEPQDIPGGMIENPEFHISGLFGTLPVEISAGVDDWTMQPIVKGPDYNAIYTTIFSKDKCLTDCNPSIEFIFYKDTTGSNALREDFELTLQPGEKEFLKSDLERDSFEIVISTHQGLFMSGFSSWHDLNVNGITFLPEYGSTIGHEEDLHVCFQSLAYTGCQYMQCIYFDPATPEPCITYIEPKVEGPRYLSLTVHPTGTAPFQIEWFNGSTAQSIVMQVQDTASEIYAGVTVTDVFGNRSELIQIVRLQNGNVDPCYFPINLSATSVNNSGSAFYSDKAEIIYRDENGEEWKSTGGVQSVNSWMNIAGHEYFDVSPMNQPAFKINLSFSVDMFNIKTGESKVFSAEDAVIGLSHR